MFNTFNWDVLMFDEAVARHGMLREALERLLPKNGLAKEQGKKIVGYLQDAWNECIGLGDPNSVMAGSVRGVVPIDHVPLLRMRSGIPAAYLVCRISDALIDAVKTGKDIDDDMILRALVLKAFEEFEARRKTADQLQEGFGFDRAEAWSTMRQVEDRHNEVSHLMLKIASLAGRMYQAFQYQAIPSKSKDPQEVDGVETGGDIDRMLDDEKASIGIDPEVAVRVSEDRAHQFEMSGETTKNRGPLVVAIDESGSMHDHREIWAKACAVALTRIAIQEGRAVRVVHFSTVCDVHDVRAGEPNDMLLVAQSHCSGGTDIDTALAVSVDQVGELELNGKQGADIVFITDGEDNYSRHHFDKMQKLGIQLWTVAIDIDIKSKKSAWLYSCAKAYVHINDATIRGNGSGAIAAVVQLRDAALDNSSREEVEEDGK